MNKAEGFPQLYTHKSFICLLKIRGTLAFDYSLSNNSPLKPVKYEKRRCL